eukprot:1788620-Rhodomonas_salina.3
MHACSSERHSWHVSSCSATSHAWPRATDAHLSEVECRSAFPPRRFGDDSDWRVRLDLRGHRRRGLASETEKGAQSGRAKGRSGA